MRQMAVGFGILCLLVPPFTAAAALSAEPQQSPYAQWTNGPPTDPSFFPIGVWTQNPIRAQQYKDIGINLYINLWQGPTEAQLTQLRNVGMPVIASQNAYARQLLQQNSALLDIIWGWKHGDEPDNAQRQSDGSWGPPILPSQIVDGYNTMKQRDPTRPVFLNLGQGVAWDGWVGRGVRTNHPEDYPQYLQGTDIGSFDIYPAASDRVIAGELWRVAYGVKRMIEWSPSGQPVWHFVETTRVSGRAGKAEPHEVKAMVWMGLVHGSMGVEYFVHEWDGNGNLVSEFQLLRDEPMRLAVAAINQQIHELAPVLNSPTIGNGHTVALLQGNPNDSIRQEFGIEPIATMLKNHDGELYLFAVRMRQTATSAEFTIPGLEGRRVAEVLGEDRQIEVIDGVFQDTFGPWDTHLYRIVPEPAAATPLGAGLAMLGRFGRRRGNGRERRSKMS